MKKSMYILFLLVLLTGSFLAGNWYNQRAARRNATRESPRILYYHDPMHPGYTSDKPGVAPDCGMPLEPVYTDGQSGGRGRENGAPPLPPGSVAISPEKQQILGVRVGTVERTSMSHSLRTLGRIVIDENRVYRVLAATDGLIREIFGSLTSSLVRKDQRLASFYSREFLTTQGTYLYALDTLDKLKQSHAIPEQIAASSTQVRWNEENLLALGVSSLQVQEIARTRQAVQTIDIRAPATALVLTRNVSFGQRFERGTELFRLVDLSRVWILADLFENEARYIQPGLRVPVSLPYQPKTFQATVSPSLPPVDPVTRTLKVRLEVDNPGFVLRPDMFVDVEFPIQRPATLAVPVDAVLDSGLKKTVFVDLGNGFFAPRTVETGWRWEEQVEIVKGLLPGEHIVLSGNFLIDSESRMKAAAAGLSERRSKDPVCGMDIDERKATASGYRREHQGRAYYFCSDACQKTFDQEPGRYVEGKFRD